MGPLHNGPLAALQLSGFSMHDLTGGAALLHIADVHLIFQHPVNRSIGPIGGFPQLLAVVVTFPFQLLVLAGTGDTLPVQQLGNSDFPISLLVQIKNASDYISGERVDEQLIMILRVFPIAIRGKGPNELPLTLLGLHGAFNFVGNIPGILLVKHILKGQ